DESLPRTGGGHYEQVRLAIKHASAHGLLLHICQFAYVGTPDIHKFRRRAQQGEFRDSEHARKRRAATASPARQTSTRSGHPSPCAQRPGYCCRASLPPLPVPTAHAASTRHLRTSTLPWPRTHGPPVALARYVDIITARQATSSPFQRRLGCAF